MNCKELAYMLADYFDGSMDSRLREELDRHLARCEQCKAFTKTYHAVSDKARRLRRDIEYEIPPEVGKRLESFIHAAALKFPEEMQGYRKQVERDRCQKVAEFVGAATAGKLSWASEILLETHCVACKECGEYFDAFRTTAPPPAGDPPEGIRSHLVALMQTLPPGEEFFLA